MDLDFATMTPVQEARTRGAISGSAFRGQDPAHAWFIAGRRAEEAYLAKEGVLLTSSQEREAGNELAWAFFEGFSEGFTD